MRLALALLRRDERGAVAVIVGLLIGTVLLGLGALVIDVGQLYAERAQLQNGADAGALAVAKLCIMSTCTPGTALSTAVTYANANSPSGVAGVNLVCGSGALGACPASTGALTDCPAAPSSGNYVDVHTSTKTAGGGTVIAPIFAKELLGNGSYTGTAVKACAQASWGGPAVATVTGFTISACEWDAATSLGTVFAPPPPAVPLASYDQVLSFRSGANGGCSTEPSGADAPGQFGWTASAGNCSTTVSSGTYAAKPGASATQACKAALAADWAAKSVIYLPVYTTVTGNGNNAVYTLKGFAAFVLTGYRIPGASASDWLNPLNNSACSNKCLMGYFTQGLIPNAGSPGGTYLGAAVIRITG